MPTTTTPALLLASDLFANEVFAVSTVELTIRMVVALAVTMLTITTATRVINHYRNRVSAVHQPIVIHHQQQLTKHTQLTLLTTGTRQLLIATNNTTTTLLAQGNDLTTPPNTPTQTTTTTAPAANPPAAAAGSGSGGGGSDIDIRTKPRNPIKHLQNKTVRRA